MLIDELQFHRFLLQTAIFTKPMKMFHREMRFFVAFVFAITLSGPLMGQPTKGRTENDSKTENQQVEDSEAEDPAKFAETHKAIEIRGWTLMLNRQLENDSPEATATMLELMDVQLKRVEDAVPAEDLRHLKTVRIWANPPYEDVRPTAEYHPSRDYLVKKERLPAMARCIELTNVARFDFECTRMPYLMLHELSHAYHDQVLGFRAANIREAFEAAVESGGYEEVDRFDGRKIIKDEAYAMSNHKEYFAESTEAYFGRNDFFPFNRQELRDHDPRMLEVLEKVWGVNAQ